MGWRTCPKRYNDADTIKLWMGWLPQELGFQVHGGHTHHNKPRSGEAGMHQALPSPLIDKFIAEIAMATNSIVNELIKLTIEICGPFHAMPQLVQYFVKGRNQDSIPG